MLLTLLAVFSVAVACDHTCRTAAGVELDDHIFSEVLVGGLSYCLAVETALVGDTATIKALSVCDRFDGIASYQHGAVLIEIVHTLGEDRFLHALDDLTPRQCSILAASMTAGLDYADSLRFVRGCRDKRLECVYPKVHAYVVERIPLL
jgi:hypothetical protein